jgi:hypothetical protein
VEGTRSMLENAGTYPITSLEPRLEMLPYSSFAL